jgi:hypothetical protein
MAAGTDPAEADLNRLAQRIIQAVRDRDVAFLLAMSRPALRDFDRAGMQPGQPLYCFVFDTSCLQWGRRSVYDLVTTARSLRVRVVRAEARWAIVQLFDQTVVDERQLDSLEYFCPRWSTDVMTWSLEYDGRTWRSVYPIFDQYTDVHCPPEGGLEGPKQARRIGTTPATRQRRAPARATHEGQQAEDVRRVGSIAGRRASACGEDAASLVRTERLAAQSTPGRPPLAYP